MDTNEPVVLLVEDDPDLLEMVETFLGASSLVVTARDGEKALRLLQVLRPDVVVTDMMMPVMDGLTFLREYRSRGHGAPVVAVSAMRPYLDEAQRLGAAMTLTKPFELRTLVSAIAQVHAGNAVPAPRGAQSSEDERQRLRAVFELELDRPAPEEGLHRFVKRVAAYFEVPTALISVVTEERQYWTAGCGIPDDLRDARGTPRIDSFCTHAVAARSALVVQDAAEHPFFHDNRFVRERGLRFYAGVPLVTRRGAVVGTLCVLDQAPRTFTHADLELLGVFASCVVSALEWRERDRAPDEPESLFPHLHYYDRELECVGTSAFRELAVVECLRHAAAGRLLASVVIAMPEEGLRARVEALARHTGGLVGRLGRGRLGWLVPDVDAETALRLARTYVGAEHRAEAVALEHYPGAVLAALEALEASLGTAGLD